MQYANGTLEVDDNAVAAVAPYMGGSSSPPSPSPQPPPGPTPSPSWSCQAGQGGSAAHQEMHTSRNSSEAACGVACLQNQGCVAFDYTTDSRSDSCRLFATSVCRLGDGGSQHR